MTKILCSDCKKTVGASALTCPHCGATTLYGKYHKKMLLCWGFDATFLLGALYCIVALFTQSGARIYRYANGLEVLSYLSGFLIAGFFISLIVQIGLSINYLKAKKSYKAAAKRSLTGEEPLPCLNGCRHCKSSDTTIADSPTVYCHWYLRDMDAKVDCERYGAPLTPLTQDQNQVS